eukprot:7540017-Ditylum_brightwellii.AAC.1
MIFHVNNFDGTHQNDLESFNEFLDGICNDIMVSPVHSNCSPSGNQPSYPKLMPGTTLYFLAGDNIRILSFLGCIKGYMYALDQAGAVCHY